MGAYIVQNDYPVAFWSCKLNDTQFKYNVSDKEFLSIVMVLTAFYTMLLVAKLHIDNDHLNITTNNTTPDCIVHWLNYIKISTLSLATTMSLLTHFLDFIFL